jgi:hypothetical protein
MLWSFWPNRRATVYALGGRDRLRLYLRARGITGWDFHSLAWERRDSFFWRTHVTITESDMMLPTRHERWISEIHSFDPSRGEAILRIAEGDAPWDAPRCTINYSWRLWDLANNREISRLQECANPFVPYRHNERAA